MAVVQLAADTDVEAVLGRDLTSAEDARIGAILDKLSEDFRDDAGQTFTADTSTVRLFVNGAQVVLPERPVTAVTSVVDDDGNGVDYTQRGALLDEVLLPGGAAVTVTYSHGGVVPDRVRLTVAQAAARVVQIPVAAREGLSQFQSSTGPFSDGGTFASFVVGGEARLSPAERLIALSYRPVRARVIVGRS